MLSLDGNPAEPVSCRISNTARSSSLNRIKHNMCQPNDPLLLAPLGHVLLLDVPSCFARSKLASLMTISSSRLAPGPTPLVMTVYMWRAKLLSGKIQCSVQSCSEWSESSRRLLQPGAALVQLEQPFLAPQQTQPPTGFRPNRSPPVCRKLPSKLRRSEKRTF